MGCGCACIKTVSWKLTVTAIVVSRPAGSFLREQRRVAAPSIRFAIACVLLAAAPTATPCFRRWRRSLPLQGSSPAPTLARRGPTPRTFAGETPCRPAGIGTGYSGKMREAMSKVQAATKIDKKARREVRGLHHAGGLASAGGTECPVPSPLPYCSAGAAGSSFFSSFFSSLLKSFLNSPVFKPLRYITHIAHSFLI